MFADDYGAGGGVGQGGEAGRGGGEILQSIWKEQAGGHIPKFRLDARNKGEAQRYFKNQGV